MTYLTLARYKHTYAERTACVRTTLLVTSLLISTEFVAIMILLG